ncbi:MAG TPA: phosphatidate cytidylyltransferase [Gammaproteobacteria bacterium]|nr:phosphatidate cytidylyltransferase [Gammaproteobacteria bacterium]
MLKVRVITALVIAPVVLALIFLAPAWLFGVAMLLMALLGAWEWSALAGRPDRGARLSVVVLFAALAGVGLALQRYAPQVPWLKVYCLTALAWWLFSLLWIAAWRADFPMPAKVLCGVLTLLPSLAAVVAIRDASPWYLLIQLLITSGADIGAYFAGRAFGKHKLAPLVSPGKTWEGVAGGVVLVAVVASVASHWLPVAILPFVLLSICVGLLSVVGDLSESLFKRQAGLKDSGSLFPGHGGVLDRVDSLTAAAPLFWLGLHALGLLP